MRVRTNAVIKLMKILFKHGHNITCNNFFTSLDVAIRLAKVKCSLVGITHQNRAARYMSALLRYSNVKFTNSYYTFIPAKFKSVCKYCNYTLTSGILSINLILHVCFQNDCG